MDRVNFKFFTTLAFCSLIFLTPASAREPKKLLTSPLAAVFGSQADIMGVKLSPDGSKVSFIQMHPEGMTVATVADLENGGLKVILSSEKDNADISGCAWANNHRLLCSFTMIHKVNDTYVSFSRLVAVNADASDYKLLLDNQMKGNLVQFQDDIVDWLPDDPDHVLITMASQNNQGSGVGLLDINTGRAVNHTPKRNNARNWVSDGRGEPRMYRYVDQKVMRWFIRDSVDSDWKILMEQKLTDTEYQIEVAGFGENPDELFVYDYFEGRKALYSMDLKNDNALTLVYSNPNVDVAGLYSLGREKRLSAVAYVEDTLKLHFFDELAANLHDELSKEFPGSEVIVVDEDWNQRFYMVFVSKGTDPGTYFRFDQQEGLLTKLAPANSAVSALELSTMQNISYPARDSVDIPAYLSLPNNVEPVALPTIILPHGGPSARDYSGYDFLVQFLTANGYAVLQSNYRGSSGYGEDWLGDGAFKGWHQAINDITDGTQYLIDEGIADPDRICAFGWSYGGYAALLSVIEEQSMYQCVISIAGVTDPGRLGRSQRQFIGGASAQAFIGTEDDVVKQGSPVFRAEEIDVPVLLVHGDKDLNVPFNQSRVLSIALKKKKKDYEFIEYDHAAHSIVPERYRIDLLTRIGDFLQENL